MPDEIEGLSSLAGVQPTAEHVAEFRALKESTEMNPTHINIVCESGHEQLLKVDGLPWAEGLAGLLDGTSPMYVHPPGDESPIGKCGICGKKVKATIIGHG